MFLFYFAVIVSMIAGLIYLRSGGSIKSDKMFPDSQPPIIVSEELIHALEQAGTKPELVAAIRQENERLKRLYEGKL